MVGIGGKSSPLSEWRGGRNVTRRLARTWSWQSIWVFMFFEIYVDIFGIIFDISV